MLKYVEKSIWKDNTKNEVVFQAAQNFVKSLPNNLTKKRVLHRVTGQSGSGKTTQVIRSLAVVFKSKNINPCYLAVRDFACYHPDYQNIKKQFGAKHIREKTNGFALKCLAYALKLLMEKGYFIVLEITLLKKVFEKYVLSLAKANNYQVQFHLLAVSPQLSNLFIENRNKQNKNLVEGERLTYKKSVNYFNKVFPKSFLYLCNQNLFNATVIMWNAYQKQPCYLGDIKNAKTAFFKHRKLSAKPKRCEETLFNVKVNFYQQIDLLL